MGKTNVGMIGYSKRNGHPYSFSAIINGYDSAFMAKSPYPVIAEYLSERSEDEFGIGDFKVSHIWTPNPHISVDIARCTYIDTVLDDYETMAEEVDVVIIARDDPSSHRAIASFFLEKGKTVFIDKPLCDNRNDLNYFYPWLQKGKLMSCSGFRYYPGIIELANNLDRDEIVFTHNVSIIDWLRYGIHVLEGITPVMGTDVKWVRDFGEEGDHIIRIEYQSGNYALIQVNTSIGFALQSSFYTKGNQHYTINYDDNFACFRELLKQFYEQYCTGIPAILPDETATIIKILLAAQLSVKNSKTIIIE